MRKTTIAETSIEDPKTPEEISKESLQKEPSTQPFPHKRQTQDEFNKNYEEANSSTVNLWNDAFKKTQKENELTTPQKENELTTPQKENELTTPQKKCFCSIL